MQIRPNTCDDNRRSTYSGFILIFVVVKVGINLLAISRFGFQRDELLHLALADHMGWGYKDVPPFIALLAKISTVIFGNSIFAARIFPTIFSGLIVWLTGLITVEFGGKKFAVALACLALIFSPAFAASGYLFEPVVFDQFWWVLAVWLLIKYLNTSSVKYLYILGAAVGVGLLTKYTMGFFTCALIIGLIISNQRKLLLSRPIIIAAFIALLIFLPNLIWQFQYHLPVITHMETLQKQQLELIKPTDFILQQLVDNGIALFVWLTGLVFLLFSSGLNKFRFLAFAFILIFAFYLVMNGKNYYLFGAYPMLFAAGAYCFERWLKTSTYALQGLVIALFTLPNLLIFPIALPVLSLNQTIAIFKAGQKEFPFLNFVVMWDDHKLHPITQNYGDMLGWEELTAKVAKTWQSLSPEQQKQTQIYANNYGEAGAIDHFGKQYNLPVVISLNSSFALWAPAKLDGRYIIYIDEQGGKNVKKLQSALESYRKTGEIENPLSIERGTSIFLLTHPKPMFNELYQRELAETRTH
jgi:hypothetical protein